MISKKTSWVTKNHNVENTKMEPRKTWLVAIDMKKPRPPKGRPIFAFDNEASARAFMDDLINVGFNSAIAVVDDLKLKKKKKRCAS